MKFCAILIVGVLVGMLVSRMPVARAQNQEPAAPSGFEPELDRFWKLWETEQPSEALRRFAPNVPGDWERVYRAADDMHSRLGGRCLGHSEIERKALGDRLVYLSFFAVYRLKPVRVELLYYKPHDKWTGIACHVDDNPNMWLQEVAQNGEPGTSGPQQLTVPETNNNPPN